MPISGELYILLIIVALIFIEKCRLFWSEVENFCRTFDLLKNVLFIVVSL